VALFSIDLERPQKIISQILMKVARRRFRGSPKRAFGLIIKDRQPVCWAVSGKDEVRDFFRVYDMKNPKHPKSGNRPIPTPRASPPSELVVPLVSPPARSADGHLEFADLTSNIPIPGGEPVNFVRAGPIDPPPTPLDPAEEVFWPISPSAEWDEASPDLPFAEPWIVGD
jgi:hypothetical protein